MVNVGKYTLHGLFGLVGNPYFFGGSPQPIQMLDRRHQDDGWNAEAFVGDWWWLGIPTTKALIATYASILGGGVDSTNECEVFWGVVILISTIGLLGSKLSRI